MKKCQFKAMKAAFIPPMLLLRTEKLPYDGKLWEYQLKLDGFRVQKWQGQPSFP
jgi:ATP-dependent DNA ligase